jgi:hypothetical protein
MTASAGKERKRTEKSIPATVRRCAAEKSVITPPQVYVASSPECNINNNRRNFNGRIAGKKKEGLSDEKTPESRRESLKTPICSRCN